MTTPFPAAVEDPIALPTAMELLEQVVGAYDAATNLDAPCAIGLVGGAAPVADYCCSGNTPDGQPCQGQLTVRVADSYPTVRFPEPFNGGPDYCMTSWCVVLEFSMFRCAPQMTDDTPPQPPSMTVQAAAAEITLRDAALIRATLSDWAVDKMRTIGLGNWIPVGPDGDCLGGMVMVTVLVE